MRQAFVAGVGNGQFLTLVNILQRHDMVNLPESAHLGFRDDRYDSITVSK